MVNSVVWEGAFEVTARQSPWLMIIAALFVTLLITSNIIAVKIGVIGPLTVPVAIVIFPLSYLFGDVLTEVYGYSTTRRIIWLGFACNVIAVIAIAAGGAIPASSYWKDQQAYNAILGATPRVLGASFAAYLVGEFVNSFVLAKLKIATQGRWLWTRTISSTLVGQGLDSAIFVTLAFVGTLPSPVIVAAILSQWIAKSAYEIIATPVTYLVVSVLKRAEGIDTFDYSTNFSPLAFAE